MNGEQKCQMHRKDYASLCTAIHQQELLSTPLFGALEASLPTRLLLWRSPFLETRVIWPVRAAKFNVEASIAGSGLRTLRLILLSETRKKDRDQGSARLSESWSGGMQSLWEDVTVISPTIIKKKNLDFEFILGENIISQIHV